MVVGFLCNGGRYLNRFYFQDIFSLDKLLYERYVLYSLYTSFHWLHCVLPHIILCRETDIFPGTVFRIHCYIGLIRSRTVKYRVDMVIDKDDEVDIKKAQDFGWLLDITKILGAIVGSLSGLAIIFVVAGYIIVLSFVQHEGLYGVTSFPREFFIEADLKFLRDLWSFLGAQWYRALIFLASLFVFLTISVYSVKRLYVRIFFFAIVLIYFFMYPFNFTSESEVGDIKTHIFMITIPFVISLASYLYLTLRRRTVFKAGGRAIYTSVTAILLLMIISIPMNYGWFLYDLDVYRIHSIEFDKKYDDTKLGEMSKNIADRTGKYFFMGHTSGKEAFLIGEEYKNKVIMIDSKIVKFLQVEWFKMEDQRTVRDVTSMKQLNIDVERKVEVATGEEGPEIKELKKASQEEIDAFLKNL